MSAGTERRQGDARGQPHAVALGRRVEQVRDADELGDEGVGRALVDVLGVADLLELAQVHDRDRVRHRQRLLLVVGHVDERDPDLALDVLQLELHRLAQLQVERAERLVEQQHRGQVDERARERDALALAARELARLGLRAVREAHELEHLPHAARDLGLCDLLAAQAEGDVLEEREMLEERVALEHRVDVAAVGRHVLDGLALEQDVALVGLLEARDHAQRRRLAAARRAEHREERPLRDVEVEALDRVLVAEALDDAAEGDREFHGLAHSAGAAGGSVRRRQSVSGRSARASTSVMPIIIVPTALISGETPTRSSE